MRNSAGMRAVATAGFVDLSPHEMVDLNGGGFWGWLGGIFTPEIIFAAIVIDLILHPVDAYNDFMQGLNADI